MLRHFLTLKDFDAADLQALIQRAIQLKAIWRERRESPKIMLDRTLALVFDKSSTRTRVSFETAVYQFGGNCIFLAPGDTQLTRGEPIADTSRVLSGMVDLIVVRTGPHRNVETYAEYSTVPVINGLSDTYHPCQLLADVQTFCELRGSIAGRKVAWIGDGNNVCHSWAVASEKFDFSLRISSPDGYEPNSEVISSLKSDVQLMADPMEAAVGADIVVTDTWASMGQEDKKSERLEIFGPFRVTRQIMNQASTDAVFMHCLPAYRGQEVDGDVLDGPQSVVWEEAENRLHSQKALIEMLLGGGD